MGFWLISPLLRSSEASAGLHPRSLCQQPPLYLPQSVPAGILLKDAALVVMCPICSVCCRYTPGSAMAGSPQQQAGPSSESVAREALKFVLSPEGAFFRDFLMNEMVQSIDALSRKQVQTSRQAVLLRCR